MWGIVNEDGEVQQILWSKQSFNSRGYLHPAQVLELWSPEELRSIGVYPAILVSEVKRYHIYEEERVSFDGERVVVEHVYKPMPLEDAKERAREDVNLWKQYKQDSVFEWRGHPFQCDPRSRDFIIGRALDAFIAHSLGQPYSIEFRDANNVDHTLDAPGMIDLGKAAAAHVQYYHDEAKLIKAQIDNAGSVDELISIMEGIDVPEVA